MILGLDLPGFAFAFCPWGWGSECWGCAFFHGESNGKDGMIEICFVKAIAEWVLIAFSFQQKLFCRYERGLIGGYIRKVLERIS